MKLRNALGLIRVSTDRQDLQRQRTDLERLARRYGLNIVKVLELHGISGTATLDNKQVQQLLREMQQPNIEGLACSAVDRVFRPRRYGHFGILDAFADAQKFLWTVREGELRPWTDADFDRCVDAGARAGSEWRELKRRCRDGKEEDRAAGLCPDGSLVIPRGVAFDRITNTWSYQEPDCSRVVKMHELLLEGKSYRTVAAAVGGGWTFQGVRTTIHNRVWAFGERVYKPVGDRVAPLVKKVIDTPLISIAMHEAVMREIERRKTRWRKTKLVPRFLSAGLLTCGCDQQQPKPMYVKCGCKRGTHAPKKDYYFCSSGFRDRSKKCGARSLQAQVVDAAVEQMIAERLTKAVVMRTIIAGVAVREPHADDTLAQAEIARLEAKRARVLEQREDGLISREACNARVHALDQELRAARVVAPVEPAADIDLKALAIGLGRAFALFTKRTFQEKRSLLERAIMDIVIDGFTIPTITLRGGFLGEILGVNLSQPLRPRFVTALTSWKSSIFMMPPD